MRLVAISIACAGCFDPTPVAGSPCPTGVCPSGLVCSPATQTCETTAVDPPMIDAAILIDAAPGCYGVGLVVICPSVALTSSLVVTGALDTDTSPLCGSYTGTSPGMFCVIAEATVTIQSVTVTGTRPLVIVAQKTVVVSGTLDVASHRGGQIGAASQPASCQLVNSTQDKGGPGGSLGGRGGAGGAGDNEGALVLAAPKLASLTGLRGGCAGGNGSVGIGGRGGGAVYVIAGEKIDVAGTINASGAGGAAGDSADSGGGGGSGGMIGLDAPTITLAATARVFANGGGGGASDSGAEPGEDPASPTIAARGGNENDGGGADGGNGSAGLILDGSNGRSGSDGGGGGGGGAGIIKVFPLRALGPSVSPAPT